MKNKIKCVICVDDEVDIREVAKMCMETVAGFEVHCCESGNDVLSCIQTIGPDIVLLDVMMPGMDGPTTLKAIRQNPALDNIPVVFLTARIQPAEVEQYKQMGAAGIIPKPFDPMSLSDQVTKIYETFQPTTQEPPQKNLLRR
jgi:CheY-like chemotaxis protein